MKGKTVVSAKYTAAFHFIEEYNLIRDSSYQWIVINTKGKKIAKLPTKYQYGAYSNGLIRFETDEGLSGYMDKNGKEVIPAQHLTGNFDEYGNTISRWSGYGLMNKKGKYIVKEIYDDIKLLKDGKYMMIKYGKKTMSYLIMDKNGKTVQKEASDIAGVKPILGVYIHSKDKLIVVRTNREKAAYTLFDGDLKPLTKNGKTASFKGVRAICGPSAGGIFAVSTEESQFALYMISGGSIKRLGKTLFADVGIGTTGDYISVKTPGGVWKILDQTGKDVLK